ncbi:hypothetical protein B0T24DRAFT_551745 [Lasiosphaeria ovina]|uniref:Bms1-type G domain-containing protein n=1 Tax=Lasiosphaeria ovina TaxID=92902 RepID=A0AAE0N7Z1_9PEZI|nr:hypothetical protein B0T24DRAFT_551745 [Lasiosphaeria ovina]
MPALVNSGHSHRPTTKSSNKPFKSRKASKGSLRNAAKGKVADERGLRKTPHQQIMSKIDRRNQAKQRQLIKLREHQNETSVFSGRDGAPKNVAVIPLCRDGDAAAAITSLNGSIDLEAEVPETGCVRVPVDRFKQKLQYIPLTRDLTASLDAARVADFVVLVLSADEEVDDLGELILRSVESQGLSTLFTVVQGLNKIEPAKQRLSILGSLKSYIMHFHPEQEKVYSLDNRQECSNLMRSLCNTTPKGIRWRDERSWMLVEDVNFSTSRSESTILTGVIRGKGLKADRLVQVGDWGTFQIEKITAAPIAVRPKKGDNAMPVEEAAAEETLDLPGEDRDDVDDLAPEEVFMADVEDEEMVTDGATVAGVSSKKGVLLDEHHYFSDEDSHPKVRKLPRGTSSYQAAWYLEDDVSDSGSDLDDFEMKDVDDAEDAAQPQDGVEGHAARETQTEAGGSEYPQSEMFIEPDEDDDAMELEAYRKKKRSDAEDDMEFPDEIELHPQVLARERLAKYRGLKSLRSSPWQEDEDRAHEPEEWQRLLRIPDYQASRTTSSREALVGGVAPGTRVHVHLKGVPTTARESYNPARPVTLFSLLRHENKRTAVNVLINLSSDYPTSLKSKEELIMQCGPRRFVINPLFSQGGNTPNDVHKYCRYLHPGQSAVATFMGPVTWGAVPALFYKRTVPAAAGESSNSSNSSDEEQSTLPLTLVATGTALPPSTSRVIAKRAVLTGHPYHIHKKIVTIRYMFFNREDVEWFKALPLWTKRGRSGHIKEPLGTHGYFKATFDERINPQDSVGVSLYKRVWPHNARLLDGGLPLEVGEVVSGEVPASEAMDAEIS